MGDHDNGTITVLVVEDEETIAESVRYNLEREGYRVVTVPRGDLVVDQMRSCDPDLIILDLMLPGLPGLDVLRRVRTESSVPVIIVTAKDGEADRVSGLELGADDYVTKPFSVRELVSRVRANLRRAYTWNSGESEDVLRQQEVVMDVGRHEVTVRGASVELRPKEFELLELLLRRAGRLVPREVLLDEVWGAPFYGDTKTLDVHIRRIREKIERDPANPRLVTTVRGLGYKFSDG
jgi:two-component system response regulator RegX3